MTPDELTRLLAEVRDGRLDPAAAAARLAPAVGDLGYASVDLERRDRCGFPEVIFCEGKTAEWVAGVAHRMAEAGQSCLATRVSAEQSAELARQFPQATQDRLARTFWLPAADAADPGGRVVVVTAGTSDLPVAQEAYVTARCMGAETTLLADVGVAGLHRLLRRRDDLAAADAVVAVAGMEGALPSVVGGLVPCPVLAVPTSVGYGAALGGLAALLTMLNACPANVAVVNIDAGFKGGYVAALIARRAHAARTGRP
jgi:NCAIR mutase (PurE)-related protein